MVRYLDDMLILSHTIQHCTKNEEIFNRKLHLLCSARSSHELRRGNIYPAEYELYNKYNEIDFTLMSENRSFGNEDRFN